MAGYPERAMAHGAALATVLKAGGSQMLLLLDRGLQLDKRRPGPWLVGSALALEACLLLWLPRGIAVSWSVALPAALAVTGVLVIEIASRTRGRRRHRPWPAAVALGLALMIGAVLTAFLIFLLLVALLQGTLEGKSLLAFYVVPLVLLFALYIEASLPLFLALTLVMVLDLGVLMDAGPVAILAVPLIACLAVSVVLFYAISPGPGRAFEYLLAGPAYPGRRR